MNKHFVALITGLFLLFSGNHLMAQNGSLLDELMEETAADEPKTEYAYATFKTTRVINGQSIEQMKKNNALYVISHRFGPFSLGWRKLWGLDQANIRFGFEYGVTDWLTMGMGRSQFQGVWDFYSKFRVLRQSKGEKKMPFSMAALLTIDVTSVDNFNGVSNEEMLFIHRLGYSYSLIIARKFNDWLSLQVSPAIAHQNLVSNDNLVDATMPLVRSNTKYAVGVGGRAKLTKRLAFTAEGFFLLNDKAALQSEHSYSFGLDLETGGHVFQFHITNTRPMFERGMITSTSSTWNKDEGIGDNERGIRFGFNIVRNFSLNSFGKNKKKKDKGEE